MASVAKNIPTQIEGLQVRAGAIATAIKNAAGILHTSQTIPIMSNVRLIADGPFLQITTSDLDVEYQQTIDLDADCSLAVTIDAKKFAAIAGAVDPSANITMSVDGGRAVIKSGRSRWQLPILPPGDFPTMTFDGAGQQVAITGVELAEAFARTSWAMYAGKTQPHMAGVLVHPVDGVMTFAASNGQSLAVSKTRAAMPAGTQGAMVPDKYMASLVGLVSGHIGEVLLAWDDRKIRASFDNVQMAGTLLDNSFPEYNRVVPALDPSPIVVAPSDVQSALKRVQIIANNMTRCVVIDRANNCLSITSASSDGGEAGEDIAAECAEGFSSGINGQYFNSVVSAIGGDSIEIHQAEASKAMLFRRVVDDGTFAVVMPMHV